jgi:hypothetical protein
MVSSLVISKKVPHDQSLHAISCVNYLDWMEYINVPWKNERKQKKCMENISLSLSLSLSLSHARTSHARNPTTLKINCIEFEWLDCDVIQSLLLPKHSTLFLLASVSPTLQYLSQFYTSELKRWRNQETDIINIKMPLEKIVILKCF